MKPKLRYVKDGPNQVIAYNRLGRRLGYLRRMSLNIWTFFPINLYDCPYYFNDEMSSIGKKLSLLNKAKPHGN